MFGCAMRTFHRVHQSILFSVLVLRIFDFNSSFISEINHRQRLLFLVRVDSLREIGAFSFALSCEVRGSRSDDD